jgi:hypothetical protein
MVVSIVSERLGPGLDEPVLADLERMGFVVERLGGSYTMGKKSVHDGFAMT